MAVFVLVPGAWLGGWCWKRVTQAVRSAAHEIFTPTLTGLGERTHLGTPETDLSTHITDVVNVLTYEDLSDVILVGHSYAGMVITGVADQAADRLSHLVYLDAVVPESGRSMLDRWSAKGQERVRSEVRARGGGWRWPIPDDLSDFGSEGLTAADEHWLRTKAIGQPLRTVTQPLWLNGQSAVRRTFILCTAHSPERPDFLVNDPSWTVHELATGHWPMISMPAALAEILLKIAALTTGAGV